MRLVICWSLCICWVVLLVPGQCWTTQEDVQLLYRTLEALTRGLYYMEHAIEEINFDGVFCVRRVEEQLEAFLQFQPDVFKSIRNWVDGLRKRAKRSADRGRRLLYATERNYTDAVGFLLSPSKSLVWYPSLPTSPSAIVQPIPCANSFFNGTFSDDCFSQMADRSSSCALSPDCLRHHQNMRMRGYVITHQVLFWEMMEARNCVTRVSRQLRTDFCSNVMRDALIAEKLNFPLSHQDLFMEQVGLCGIWGFQDFHKKKWLDKIFEWQRPSGCFADVGYYKCEDYTSQVIHSRVKRTERWLNDGCLSHKTGVALLALVASLRFEAEKIFASK